MKFGDAMAEMLDALGSWLMRPRPRLMKWLAIVAVIVVLPLAGLALLPTFLEALAPPLDTSQDLYTVNRPIAFTFLDAEGRQVGHRGAIVGERLKLEDMPAYLPAAFIAMEDRRYYSHGGIDMRGLLRAMWINFRAHHVVQGGSTIAQQTAKIVFLNPERTFHRKIQELIDAESLEKSLTKKQILELYLNRIYLGSGAYGVDGAAHVYFAKSARDLSLSEAAMLATLTTAPSVFSPRRDLAAAQQRANIVLREMVQTRAITKQQAVEARAQPAVVTDRTIQDARNYFLDTAADEALADASVNGKRPTVDLVVHTTLEPALEEASRHALNRVLRKEGRKTHANEGAVVVMKPDGAVNVLLGGRDYDESVFNRATQARRQPGSAFKPFVYLAAIENGISPWDTRTDGPVDIDGWSPTNYGGREFGTITLASALAHSVNTITASLGQEVGISTVIEAAKRLGIKSPLEQNASLALGTSEVTPLELTAAYAAFANGGLKADPYFVTEVEDSGGHILYRREPPHPQRVIASHVDRDLTEMLYGVVTEGTGRTAAIVGHEAAGKTGTTQDYHDAWFVGFTADYVAGVWVGNDNSSPMKNVTGGTLPAEIWKAVMTSAEEGLPAKPLDKSAPQAPTTDENGVVTAESGTVTIEGADSASSGVDEETGGSAGEASTEATDTANNHPSENRHSFWDWLFGKDSNSGARPANAEPPRSADENRSATEHASQPRPVDQSSRIQRLDNPPPPPGNDESGTGDPSSDAQPPHAQIYGPADHGIGGAPPTRHVYIEPRREIPLHEQAPPPPRSSPPPPPPPDSDDEGAHHPDDDDNGD